MKKKFIPEVDNTPGPGVTSNKKELDLGPLKLTGTRLLLTSHFFRLTFSRMNFVISLIIVVGLALGPTASGHGIKAQAHPEMVHGVAGDVSCKDESTSFMMRYRCLYDIQE
ncbi:MAG: hypothetical protein P8J85_10015 [Alphaproteobacteria bacterium]|nr:hypothetical protein [Alphaproteobacteria bacterium]